MQILINMNSNKLFELYSDSQRSKECFTGFEMLKCSLERSGQLDKYLLNQESGTLKTKGH